MCPTLQREEEGGTERDLAEAAVWLPDPGSHVGGPGLPRELCQVLALQHPVLWLEVQRVPPLALAPRLLSHWNFLVFSTKLVGQLGARGSAHSTLFSAALNHLGARETYD